MCTTPIPAYSSSRGGNNIFDQSPSNNHRCIIWSTVEGYIGKYLLSLRRDEKFKNIEDFIGLEWWNDNVINPIVLVKQQDHVADAFFEYIHHQYYQ